MALDMSSSSIGVSREGMKKVKDGIKIYLIDESIKSMNNNVELLKNNVDNYWHGASAKAFKLKIDSEKSKVVTILKVLEAKMEIDLGVMATNSAIADAEVATSLFALAGRNGGSTGGGGTTGGSTPTPASGPVQPIQQDPTVEDPDSTPENDNKEADDINVDGGDPTPTPQPQEPIEEPEQPEQPEEPEEVEDDTDEGNDIQVDPEPQPQPEDNGGTTEEPPQPQEPNPEDDNTLSGSAGDEAPQPTPTPQENQPGGEYGAPGQTSYDGDVHSKGHASAEAKATNGVVTQGNQSYAVGDTTNIAAGQLSMRDYIYLVGQVAGESANDSDDMLGVCTTILNRAENNPGSTIEGVLAGGYWPWGETYRKYVNVDASGNPTGFKTLEQLGQAEYNKLQQVLNVVADAMNGTRNLNHNVIYYSGDGVHNYFSDIL